jgi:hypothetical protein
LYDQQVLGEKLVDQLMQGKSNRNALILQSARGVSPSNEGPQSAKSQILSPKLIQPDMNPPLNKEKLDYKGTEGNNPKHS